MLLMEQGTEIQYLYKDLVIQYTKLSCNKYIVIFRPNSKERYLTK